MEESVINGKYNRIPSKLELVDGLRESFAAFLKDFNMLNSEIESWKLIFSESLTNAIVHGNQKSEQKFVDIEWGIREQNIILSISDEGKGPPDKKINDPSLPENPYATGGRGLFLIQNFCDKWEHWKSSNGYKQLLSKEYSDSRAELLHNIELEQAIEELSLCYESISAFYRLGNALIQSENVSSFINQAIDDMLHVVNADAVWISFNNSLQKSLIVDLLKLDLFNVEAQKSPTHKKVMASGMEIVWETVEELDNDLFLEKYKAGCSVPIMAGHEEALGFLTVARVSNTPYMSAAELNTIRTFADLIGIAVANANSQITRTDEQRALRELEIAANIQNTLVPVTNSPETDRWRAFVRRLSALQIGGDYVEAFEADNGALYLVIADVMGKGVSAAFFAAMLRTTIHINIDLNLSLLDLIHSINKTLCQEAGDLTMFSTCSIARVSPDLTSVEIVNAGHCHVLFFENNILKTQVEPSGPPLGLFTDAEYKVENFKLTNNNKIIMVTDGVYEWEINENEMWTWEEFIFFVEENSKLDPMKFWDSLQYKIKNAVIDGNTGDDQTMLYWETK